MKSRILATTTAAVLALGSLAACNDTDDDCEALPAGTRVVDALEKPKPGGGSKSKSKSNKGKTSSGGSHSDDCDED